MTLRSHQAAALATALCLGAAAGCGGDGDEAPDDGGAGDADAGPVVVLPDEREPCADPNPLRNPYFGDLHVHTKFSFDAAAWGTRSTPEDAYRFARGEPLDLFPYDSDGEGERTVQLARPLDFAAVTEHAEFLAEVTLCTDPSSPAYDSSTCTTYRNADSEGFNFGEFATTFLTDPPRRPGICSPYDDDCVATRDRVWERIQDAAEAFYDRTEACEFTTFVAYEWSGTTGSTANIHRNVIFRNRSVPRVPTSFVDAPTPGELWDAMDATCNDTGTPCEALAIPHNSNVGGGMMFEPVTSAGAPYTRGEAARRSRLEPLVEIYQHKGASECIPDVPDPLASEDPLCDFEQVHPSVCTGDPSDPEGCLPLCERSGGGGLIGGCVAVRDFVRPALLRGLEEQARVGANPFDFGLIGSTDTHSGAAGHVEEAGWTGHLADRDDTAADRLRAFDGVLVGIRTNSPGGLAVLWAEENSRDALFDAMQRREAYATSGTRIVARLFGGWGYPDDLCSAPEPIATGYDEGVPMGGELPPRPSDAGAPVFFVSAMRDAFSAPLQRIQIVKGWVEDEALHEEVYDVAPEGGPDEGAPVDLDTCEPDEEPGADSLCEVWSDPDFDPAHPAFYYARVLENPTCRWSHRQCLAAEVNCATVDAGDPFEACCDGSVPATIQERAWTSPVWYAP
ncbi:MAG: DUF3604 domain-containing protein [Myxococcota bacterium]